MWLSTAPIIVEDMIITKGKSTKSKWEGQIEQNHLFFKILAICHDTVCEHMGEETKLSASNPDDEALVAAAAHFGFKFTDRQDNFLILRREVPRVLGANGYEEENDNKVQCERAPDQSTVSDMMGSGVELSDFSAKQKASGEQEEADEEGVRFSTYLNSHRRGRG